MAMGATQPLTQMSIRNNFLGGKGSRYVELETLLPSCANCLEILGALMICPCVYRDSFAFIFLYCGVEVKDAFIFVHCDCMILSTIALLVHTFKKQYFAFAV
jgi:hypothetical protein